MSRGSAWAARRERAVASVEELEQRLLAEWTDHGFRARTEWEDNRARRRAEFGVCITAIAAQVASDVSAVVASEVSAAVAAALQAARAGHHEYLDHAPTTTSTPTVSMADDNPSVPDASIVVSTQRSTSASAQSPTFSLPGRPPTTAPAATSASSKVTVDTVPEPCFLDLEPSLELVTTPPKCSTEGLNGDPLVMPEQQDHYKEYANSVQDASIPCVLPVIVVFCLPILPWDGNSMRLPSDQLYGQKSNIRLPEHDMHGGILTACGSTVFQCNVHLGTIHGSFGIDKLQSGISIKACCPQLKPEPYEVTCCSAISLALHATSYSSEICVQVLAEKRKLSCELFQPRMFWPYKQIIGTLGMLSSGEDFEVGTYFAFEMHNCLPSYQGTWFSFMTVLFAIPQFGVGGIFFLIMNNSSGKRHGLAENSQRPSAEFGTLTSQFIQCTFKLHQLKIAWIPDWDYLKNSSVKIKELLLPYTGEEILQVSSIVIYYYVVGIAACCKLGTKFRSADAFLSELHKLKFIDACFSPSVAILVLLFDRINWEELQPPTDTTEKGLSGAFPLPVQTYGFGMSSTRGRAKIHCERIVSGQVHYSYELSVPDNLYLKILVDFPTLELVSCKLPQESRPIWEPVSSEGVTSMVAFEFFAYVTISSSRSLEFCQRKFSWDPSIWALLCLFGLLIQAKTAGRRNIADPAYYRIHCLDHAYYFNQVHVNQHYYLDDFCDQMNLSDDYFLEQVGIVWYLNLAKFRLNYGTHCDLGEIMKHQVPWSFAMASA
uniref:Uncharacterized protein n=1 Tax=Aegilops tauschii TaxID=37682 RepID=M8BS80_AEGTA